MCAWFCHLSHDARWGWLFISGRRKPVRRHWKIQCKDMEVAQHRDVVDPGADSSKIISRICTCTGVDQIVESERYLCLAIFLFCPFKLASIGHNCAALPVFPCKGRVLSYQSALRSVWKLNVLIFLFALGKDLEVMNHSVLVVGLGEHKGKRVREFTNRRKQNAYGMSDPTLNSGFTKAVSGHWVKSGQ